MSATYKQRIALCKKRERENVKRARECIRTGFYALAAYYLADANAWRAEAAAGREIAERRKP